jgi:hypothetical protein
MRLNISIKLRIYCRALYSGIYRRVARWKPLYVSGGYIASIFRVEEESEQETSVKWAESWTCSVVQRIATQKNVNVPFMSNAIITWNPAYGFYFLLSSVPGSSHRWRFLPDKNPRLPTLILNRTFLLTWPVNGILRRKIVLSFCF